MHKSDNRICLRDAFSSHHVVLAPVPMRASDGKLRGPARLLLDTGDVRDVELVMPFTAWSDISTLVDELVDIAPEPVGARERETLVFTLLAAPAGSEHPLDTLLVETVEAIERIQHVDGQYVLTAALDAEVLDPEGK